MILRFAILVIACALDVGTTRKTRQSGRGEKNLIPAFLIERFGFWPAALGTKVFMVVLAVVINKAGFYDGLALANAIAAGRNFWILARKK